MRHLATYGMSGGTESYIHPFPNISAMTTILRANKNRCRYIFFVFFHISIGRRLFLRILSMFLPCYSMFVARQQVQFEGNRGDSRFQVAYDPRCGNRLSCRRAQCNRQSPRLERYDKCRRLLPGIRSPNRLPAGVRMDGRRHRRRDQRARDADRCR